MKDFIIWYAIEGGEDYVVMASHTAEEARERFEKSWSAQILEIREVDESIQEHVE